MTPDPAPDETERAWLIARAWAHLDYREVIAIRGIAPDLARILEGLCSMYAIRIGGEGQTTYTRIRGAVERPMSPRDAADDLSRDGQDMRLDERKIGDEGCTCTLPPSYEGPCSWCDIHGQPSVAFEQGVAEGENSGRVFERELRDLRTKMATLRAELAETRTAMDAFHRSASAMRRDRDRLSVGLREMARRASLLRQTGRQLHGKYMELLADRDRLRDQDAPHENCCDLGRDGDPDIRRYHVCDTRDAGAAEDPDGDHHYLSTACEHQLHERCRLRCKFCATGCVCSCHRAGTPDYSVPGDHHDNVCERRSGHEWPFCRCKDRAEVHEEPDDTPADRGPLSPNPPPWPVSIDGVLTSPKPGENFDIPAVDLLRRMVTNHYGAGDLRVNEQLMGEACAFMGGEN